MSDLFRNLDWHALIGFWLGCLYCDLLRPKFIARFKRRNESRTHAEIFDVRASYNEAGR